MHKDDRRSLPEVHQRAQHSLDRLATLIAPVSAVFVRLCAHVGRRLEQDQVNILRHVESNAVLHIVWWHCWHRRIRMGHVGIRKPCLEPELKLAMEQARLIRTHAHGGARAYGASHDGDADLAARLKALKEAAESLEVALVRNHPLQLAQTQRPCRQRVCDGRLRAVDVRPEMRSRVHHDGIRSGGAGVGVGRACVGSET